MTLLFLIWLLILRLGRGILVTDLQAEPGLVVNVKENNSVTLRYRYILKENSTNPYVFGNVWRTVCSGKDLSTIQFNPNTSNCTALGTLGNSVLYTINCTNTTVSITINRVTEDQHGLVLHCSAPGQKEEASATIYVTVPLQNARITSPSKPVNLVLEKTEIQVKCNTSVGRPLASITWKIGPDLIDSALFNNSAFPRKTNEPGGLFFVESILSLVTSRQMNGNNLTCLANNTVDSVQTDWITLNIVYPPTGPPQVPYFENARNLVVLENMTGFVNCSISDSNPRANLSWQCENVITFRNIVVRDTVTQLEVKAFRKSSPRCTCTAFHPFATADSYNTSVDIDVLFPSTITQFLSGKVSFLNTIDVIQHRNITVTCLAEGNPPPVVSWFGENITLLQTNNLTLNDVVSEQNGNMYTCSAHNIMNDTNSTREGNSSKSFRMNVRYPPSLESLVNYSVIENESVIISCKYRPGNSNEMQISWKNRSINNTELRITAVHRTHSQLYTCEVWCKLKSFDEEVIEDTSNVSFTLDVLYPPKLTVGPEIVRNEGDQVKISCNLTGGKTTVQIVQLLTKNGTSVVNSSLFIANVTRNDSGVYTCVLNYTMQPTQGNNVTSSDTKSIKVNVLYKPFIERFLIRAHEQDVYEAVGENSSVQFECAIDSNPNSTMVLFFFNNDSLRQIQSEPNRNILFHDITSIDCSDTGIYICAGNNTVSNTEYRKYISVKCSPRQLKPTELQQSINATLHSSATFSLTVVANPLPCYEWFRIYNDSDEVPVDINLTHINSINMSFVAVQINLTVINVTESSYGEYIVKVNNTYGLYKHEFYLNKDIKLQVTESDRQLKKNTAGPAIGGAVGGVSTTAAVIFVIFIIRKRIATRKPINREERHEYQNVIFMQEPIKNKRPPAVPPPDDEINKVYQNVKTQDRNSQIVVENDYWNTMEIIDVNKGVRIAELFSYVTSKTIEDLLEEFETFPKGMSSDIPYRTARSPEYVAMNRYQGIYPYDHSRVVIENKPDFFINANYIDGFRKRRAYIASLGPTSKHTRGFSTFWDMVWYEQSDVIVMLTNLVEPSGMKCEKYWAECGATRALGEYVIQSQGEEVTAEYTVRTFVVSKDDEVRSITQLHYTAWPDKSVPGSVTSLIEFRQRVKVATTRSTGPLIVHCSAGVGRTGTYIALDRLIEQGQSTASVHVYDCVLNMRKQRVNMVQTPEQYVYLHQALVYCLAFDIEPVASEAIDEYIQTTNNNVFSQLYQQLRQSVEKESAHESDARTKNREHFDMNRLNSDIPGDAYRVRVYMDKAFGESDYINAVYLGGFLRLEHFIIAQTPLPDTLDDFVTMLYQEKSCCIISLDDCQQNDTNQASYVPFENHESVFGYVSVSCLSLEMKSTFIRRKLVIGHAGKHESGQRIVYHFEYSGWKHDESLPKDPETFMKFVREVDQQTDKIADAKSHVVVHCKSGSERSGLFCALSNLIQKMEHEHQVSVVNTLRRVRERRKTAIPTMEQLKFCYQAVDAFVKSHKIG